MIPVAHLLKPTVTVINILPNIYLLNKTTYVLYFLNRVFSSDFYSFGVAQTQSFSIPRLSLCMAILKKPYSPQ